MLFKKITILDDLFQTKEDRYVGIKEGKIDYIGTEAPAEDYGESYDGKNKLLLSGFFNAHAHTPMGLMRGYGENLFLSDWLNQKIFPFEAQMNGRDAYYSTLLGIAESLRFGIVASTDMYYFGKDIARAVLESGIKENIGTPFVCFGDENLEDLPYFQEAKALFEEYHEAGEGRVRIDMSIHGEYTSTEKTVRQMAEFSRSIGTNLHIHVSETKAEHEACKERHGGLTPIQYLDRLGVLESPVTAAHCVHIEEEDRVIMAEKGVTAASCPVSNLKLASGICDVQRLLDKGINVAIGTDSTASNNSLNFIEEMKFFALAAKGGFQDPVRITPTDTLRAATLAGAISQGRRDCGRLAAGCRADLIVMDLDVPNMYPVHDLAGNVVYAASGSDVLLTMVDGRVLYQNGEYKTIDLERVKFETASSRDRILGTLKG